MNKSDPNKHWFYEIIEEIISIGKFDYFRKVLKKIYEVENSDFSKIDLLINHMMYIASKYKLVDHFNDKDEYKRLKMRFHAVLWKTEEELWSTLKIIKVMSILRENFFEGILHNFLYVVVRANSVVCDFSITDLH